ncbi:MAG TPA: RDD family protein [Steroidobacteraceae bacterium]|nr:RDD family protein [Steroidobacteraceae bacterium]
MLAADRPPVKSGRDAPAKKPRRVRDNPVVVRRESARSDNYKRSRYMNTPNPYAPPRANVSDVADATEELELAGRGIRLGAYLLDAVIGGVLIYLPAVLVGGFSAVGENGMPRLSGLGGVLVLVGLAVWLYFTIIYVARNGQTIAKKLLGIKVVRSDGSKASLGRIFWLRNVVNAIIGIIPFYVLIDHLVIFGDARQCVHDKIADTIVVVA